MLRKVASLSRHFLRPISARFVSKDVAQSLIEEIKPKKTPFHINEDGPDFPEFDNSMHGNWLPQAQDLVSQCLLPPDQPYIYQEIEPYTLKVLEERRRKMPPHFFLNLPFDLNGVQDIPLIAQKELITKFIEKNQIKREKIPIDLAAHLKRSLSLLGNNEELPLAKYEALFQTQMAEKVRERKEELRKEGVEVKWEGDQDLELSIQNSLFIKGVYIDRSKNGTNFDYIIEQKNEERGLQEYLHKYFMGDNLIYPMNALGSPNLNALDSALQMQHLIEQGEQKIIWRVVALVKTNGTLKATKANKQVESQNSQYSDLHLVVFENELKTPPHITLCDLDFEEWVDEHRYRPWTWKIADFDFYMKGNPFYSARVDLRKMEALKPVIKQLPNIYTQKASQIYGIKSIHAAKSSLTYTPIEVYSLQDELDDDEDMEHEDPEEQAEQTAAKKEEDDDEIDWDFLGPTHARRMHNRPWVPYVTDNVYEH